MDPHEHCHQWPVEFGHIYGVESNFMTDVLQVTRILADTYLSSSINTVKLNGLVQEGRK